MSLRTIRNRILPIMLSLAFVAAQLPVTHVAAAEDTLWTCVENKDDGFYVVSNPGGKTLSVNDLSTIITVDGLAFKDLNGNSELDTYEDWRIVPEDRAVNLVSLLTIDEIAPLMMASMHLSNVSGDLEQTTGMFGSSNLDLINKGMRTFLNAAGSSPTAPQVEWNNALQAYAEADAKMLGIPVNIMSDPRSNAGATDGFYDGSSSSVSKWPGSLGFGATFNPAIVEQFGSIASREYRALGITTALSPQIDIATEPRWSRVSGTFSESPILSADISVAYVKGFQTTGNGEWGDDSVAAMLKHWPGDGSGEAGRESHANVGKYAVYPGDNLSDHIIPFAAALDKDNENTTLYAASIMPSYSIGIDKDGEPLGGDERQYGSGVSPYKLQETLYGALDFGGYVCTDWMVAGSYTDDGDGIIDNGGGTAWGTGHLQGGERVWAGLSQGVDMYGGLESINAVKAAYDCAVEELGEEEAAAHFADSARRILLSFFRLGLFENPYRSVEESLAIVGSAEFNEAGYAAQLESIVMLKNKDNVISKAAGEKKTVYIPLMYSPAAESMFGPPTPAGVSLCIDQNSAEQIFNVVTDEIREGADMENLSADDIERRTDFSGVDFALLKVSSPLSPGDMFSGSGYDINARNVPGDVMSMGIFGPTQLDYREDQPIDNGYFPKTVQYREYTANPDNVREYPLGVDPVEEEMWIAAGEEPGKSRYYGGKSVTSTNEAELDFILDTVEAVGELPVVVVIAAQSAMVFNEFESEVDGIILSFGTSDAAFLEVVGGNYCPNGLLPIQMPADMETVEKQLEDVAFDMECHVDTEGNVYDFGFGLNWNGQINDARTIKYTKDNKIHASVALEAAEKVSNDVTVSEDVQEEVEPFVIGVSMNSADQFRTSWLSEFKAQAEAKGHTVYSTNADNNPSAQISDIESLIARKPDVIIVTALDSEGIVPAIEACDAAKIPVICIDMSVATEVTATVYDKQGLNGVIQGQYLLNWLDEDPTRTANIGYIVGMYSMEPAMPRMNDFKAITDEDDRCTWIADKEAGWSGANAMSITEDWIQAYPEMNVFACMSDEMAIGAIQALTAAGKNMDDILVMGVDGSDIAIEYLKSGELDCTAARDVKKEVTTALKTAESVVSGKPVNKEVYPEAIFALTSDDVE